MLVPAGTWYCAGPIVLLSNVNFHLAPNCTIYFSPDPRDYAKDGPVDCGANGKLYYCRWQGNDCLNFGSPIYARNATRIALTGEGPTSVLNGQGMTPFAGSGNASTCWWTYKGIIGKYGCVDARTPSRHVSEPEQSRPARSGARICPRRFMPGSPIRRLPGSATRTTCRRSPKPAYPSSSASSAWVTTCGRA